LSDAEVLSPKNKCFKTIIKINYEKSSVKKRLYFEMSINATEYCGNT